MKICQSFAVNVLIDKFPNLWNDYKFKLKYERRQINLHELLADIMIEDVDQQIYQSATIPSSLDDNGNIVESGFGSKNKFKGQKNKGKALNKHSLGNASFKRSPRVLNFHISIEH